MGKKSALFQMFLYCLCVLLVILFVNLYGVFAIADRLLPASVVQLLPILVVVLFILAVLTYFLFKNNAHEVSRSLLWIGGTVCVVALIIPDSRFPAKRIHVAEYMALVCLVRYAMSWRIQGGVLLFFSILATILFGMHDELLQGLHPSRTYGLRDMLVNSFAAVGGGLIWHGCSLFVRPELRDEKRKNSRGTSATTAYLCWFFLGIMAFVIPLSAYRQETIPYWPLLPLSGAVVLWSLYYQDVEPRYKYGCFVVNCLAYLFLLYPVAINVSSYTFY